MSIPSGDNVMPQCEGWRVSPGDRGAAKLVLWTQLHDTGEDHLPRRVDAWG